MAIEADLYVVVRDLASGSRGTTLRDVEQVLDLGVSPDCWRGPSSPLRYAVQTRNVRLLDLLVRKHADANIQDARNVTPLHIAAFDGKADCVRVLLRARANTNSKDRHGQTPLFFAPSRQICELLLSARADANVTNKKQQTPLHMAAHAGLSDALCCMAEATKGRTAELKDQNGHTPLHYAANSPSKSAAQASLQLCRPPRGVRLFPPLVEERSSAADGVTEGCLHGHDETDARPPGSVARGVGTEVCPAVFECPVFEKQEGGQQLSETHHHAAVHRDGDGCLRWKVLLVKRSREDRYGFAQANGRVDFEAWLAAGWISRDAEPGTRQPEEEPESVRSPLPGPEELVVRGVHDGLLVWEWNQAHPQAAICCGDRVCSVNGQRKVEAMQRELRKADKVEMEMLRYPERFSMMLNFNSPQERLGFRFERPTTGSTRQAEPGLGPYEAGVAALLVKPRAASEGSTRAEVRIAEILEGGLVADHNKAQVAMGKWYFVVMPMMCIEAVNDVSGNAFRIANELRRRKPQVILSIWRAEQSMLLVQRDRAANAKTAPRSVEGRRAASSFQ